MRRILVERARKKRQFKHGGHYARVELTDAANSLGPSPEEVIMVSDLLESLAEEHPIDAQIVKLHYFAGLNISEAGRVVGVSNSTAHRHWTFARAWLLKAIRGVESEC
jgi:RNA polymerase sigma factor (TIGR02999 family)